jgi:hypothetical protein
MFTRTIVTVLIAGAALLGAVHVTGARDGDALTSNGPSLNGLDVNASDFSLDAVVLTLPDGHELLMGEKSEAAQSTPQPFILAGIGTSP